MKIREAEKLLNAAGRNTVCKNGGIEEVPSPYENYRLLKKEDGKWIYGFLNQEKTNAPYLTETMSFDTEEEGSKFFFLKCLTYHYSSTMIQDLLSRKELKIYDDGFDVPKLRNALAVASVSKDLFYVDRKPSHRAIVLEKVQGGYLVSFYGDSGQKVLSSTLPPSLGSPATELSQKPVKLSKALFFVFQQAVRLHLFETEVTSLLKKEKVNVKFTDGDVKLFILPRLLPSNK